MGQQIGYRCNACDERWNAPAPVCPQCGSANIGRLFGQDTGGGITPSGTLEAVADNTHGDKTTIQYLSTSGSRADSTLTPSQLELTMRAPIDLGRKGEASVTQRVLTQLRRDGRQTATLPHRDNLGEDAKVVCDGEPVTIQIVSVPVAPDFVGEASRGSAHTSVSIDRAAEWIFEAVTKKHAQYGSRPDMLLAIDSRAVGVLVSPAVISAFDAAYGDICEKTGFGAVWIVGPSDSRATKLGSSRW